MGVLFCFCLVPGSLSNNDGEGFKNVTKNVNLRRLKLDHGYLSRLIRPRQNMILGSFTL